MSTHEAGSAVAVVGFILEDADAEALGVDPATGQASELINFCRAIIAAMSTDPSSVLLVIAGDFVGSVKSRLPEGAYRESFDEARGAGLVAAKTMVVGDEIHVVFPAWYFLDSAAMEARMSRAELAEFLSSAPERDRLTRRTAVHEAQHVAMEQAGEDKSDFPSARRARRNFLSVAHQVLTEYRAELGVHGELRGEYETDFPLESLAALKVDLALIDDAYQADLDVDALSHNVLQQTQHLWKALAYLAAARRIEGVDSPIVLTAADQALWDQMGGEHWAQFEGILGQMVSAHTRVSTVDLQRVTDDLADLLEEWLISLGFSWRDIENIDSTRFDIVSRHLLND